jgi:hypothetical protein
MRTKELFDFVTDISITPSTEDSYLAQVCPFFLIHFFNSFINLLIHFIFIFFQYRF